MDNIKILALALCLSVTTIIEAAEHEVKMLSSNKGEMMVFEPPVLKIEPGDTSKEKKLKDIPITINNLQKPYVS